jgi:hypothetical protein
MENENPLTYLSLDPHLPLGKPGIKGTRPLTRLAPDSRGCLDFDSFPPNLSPPRFAPAVKPKRRTLIHPT